MMTPEGSVILVVEDDEEIQRLVRDLLSQEGFTVEAVHPEAGSMKSWHGAVQT